MFALSRPRSPRRGLAALAALALLGPLGAAPPAAHAASARSGFGLGLVLGEPTGLSAKAWLSGGSALQFHVSWDFTDAALVLSGDYLVHLDVLGVHTPDLDLLLTLGGGVKVGQHTQRAHEEPLFVGLRVPIGLSMPFKSMPLELFLEAVPGLRVLSKIGFDVDLGLGARWFF